MLNLYMALGAVGTRYNPLINYTWSTLPVASDYITDGVELVVNYNTHSDNSAWGVGTTAIITALEDGFTKVGYGVLTNVLFTLRDSNSEFSSNLVIGEKYLIDIDVKTDSSLCYPIISGFQGTISSISVSDGVVNISGEMIATSTKSDYVRAYCDAGTRVMYWKINSFQKVIQEPNKRYLRDSGTTPKHNALLATGRGVKTNSVDQSIIVGVL